MSHVARHPTRDVPGVVYADASALVKLVVREPESRALVDAIAEGADVVSSVVSVPEVARALRVGGLVAEIEVETVAEILDGVTLVDVDVTLARSAAAMVSESLRPLDAIHLATALAVDPDIVLVYDRRLGRAALDAGLRVMAPGAAA